MTTHTRATWRIHINLRRAYLLTCSTPNRLWPLADTFMTEREVKKANRDLSHLLSSMESNTTKVDTLQRKYSELLAEMKRTEREHIKSKKRGDQLQKEKDTQRSELTKSNSMKEKLEKLSRELTKENKKLKVRTNNSPMHKLQDIDGSRVHRRIFAS